MNRFTEQARDVLHGVHEVAEQFVGTEHLLITIARSPGVASTALCGAGLTATRLEALITAGAGGRTGTIPFSPGAKQAIELAAIEATAHGDTDIGTAHLLLGLLSVQTSAASKAVEDAGFDRTQVRQRVDEVLASGARDSD